MIAGLFHLGGNARFDKYIREFKYKTATEINYPRPRRDGVFNVLNNRWR